MSDKTLASKQLVLASSSRYRQALLKKLGLNFIARSPDIDETAMPGETPSQLVQRLATSKARKLASDFSDALIIGSDQVAVLDEQVLGKPGCHEKAIEQLQRSSGRTVIFHTGLCLLDSQSDQAQIDDVTFEVKFRPLSLEQIERYVAAEKPYDAAGSFKSEGLGITLFEYLKGDDPNALVGLPLIRLSDMLQSVGITLP